MVMKKRKLIDEETNEEKERNDDNEFCLDFTF